MVAYGRMIDEVLEDLGSEDVVLVGHSMGAAAVLAASPSSRVGGIVLVDPAGFTKPALGLGLLGSFVGWMLHPRPSTSARLVQRMQSPHRAPSAELTEWFTLLGRCCRSTGAPGPSAPEVVDRWRHTPRTVIVGEDDVFFPPERLAPVVEERLGVPVHAVPGAGHLLPHEDPQAVADAVIALA
jgi:pimeloyl-ACP methyl ester carboxylesterase